MELINQIVNNSKLNPKKIVLPETEDNRIIEATIELTTQKIVHVVLIGNRQKIHSQINNENIINNITIYDPEIDIEMTNNLANFYYEKRKHKGLTLEAAKETIITKPHFYGGMLVANNLADGMVAGAVCTTGETIRSIIHSVGTKKGSSIISSFFIMLTKNTSFGDDGILFFADCAVNPNPTAEQLADIAIDTATSYKQIMQKEPKVGLLSFSSYGSAKHPLVDKVLEAKRIALEKNPNLKIDGEFQLDTAILPSVAKKKAPTSEIAGQANCLIFPDLQSGNIGYKLTERIGEAMAVGPIIQGSAKPINDLSRGCSISDIVYVSAITGVLAE